MTWSVIHEREVGVQTRPIRRQQQRHRHSSQQKDHSNVFRFIYIRPYVTLVHQALPEEVSRRGVHMADWMGGGRENKYGWVIDTEKRGLKKKRDGLTDSRFVNLHIYLVTSFILTVNKGPVHSTTCLVFTVPLHWSPLKPLPSPFKHHKHDIWDKLWCVRLWCYLTPYRPYFIVTAVWM